MQYQELLKAYPFNLAVDLYGSPEDAIKISIPGLEAMLKTLNEREQSVIHFRYAEGKTLRECGEQIGVQAERARQIIATVLRKLRYPSRPKRILAVSMEQMFDLNCQYDELNQKFEQLKAAFEEATRQKPEPEAVEPLRQLALARQKKICEVDFSRRAYHCLIRSGMTTLGDITDMTLDELLKIRNLGKSTAEEIVTCIQENGLSLKNEE